MKFPAVYLLWCLIPLAGAIFSYWYFRVKATDVWVASVRMVVQLILVGYGLVIIFEQPSVWISTGLLLVMAFIAGWISIRPVRQYKGVYVPALCALMVSAGVHLFISVELIIQPGIWYEPSVLIPIGGMYFANTMNAISLAAERYMAVLSRGLSGKMAASEGFQAAMIPQINGLLAVGLVALPGMMTGQILSGVSPLIAVRYQIMIMAMLLGAASIAILLFMFLHQHWNKTERPTGQL